MYFVNLNLLELLSRLNTSDYITLYDKEKQISAADRRNITERIYR